MLEQCCKNKNEELETLWMDFEDYLVTHNKCSDFIHGVVTQTYSCIQIEGDQYYDLLKNVNLTSDLFSVWL